MSTNLEFPISSPEGGLPSAVRWSHLMLQGRLRAGDVVVDATAGNGHDTLFLARSVLPGGQVIAFDVQSAALDQTRERLARAGVEMSAVRLLNQGHETLATALGEYLRGRLKAVMFNLGYLPGSDKALITQTTSTMKAISAALDWLTPGGLMTVVVYPGHAGGAEEAAAVTQFATEQPPSACEVQHIRPVNRSASPPECWAFWKRR